MFYKRLSFGPFFFFNGKLTVKLVREFEEGKDEEGRVQSEARTFSAESLSGGA